MSHDLVIRNGTVVDGTGAPRRQADVAIDGDRISNVGIVEDRGREEVDATGCIVTPGFIDPHTHLDAQLCWDPLATPSSLHGVTTVIIGNCGFGVAPCAEGGGEYLLKSLAVVEEIPYESTSLGVPFAWSTWPQFLSYLESLHPVLNIGGLVPHSALRYYVMGERSYQEAATDDERRALAAELRRSLDGGALGFASSRGFNHVDHHGNPMPSRLADDAEMRALVMECRGRPWQINMGTKVSPKIDLVLEEVDRYAAWTKAAGAKLTWTPFLAEPSEPVWRAVLAHHHELAEHVNIRPQGSPNSVSRSLHFDRGGPFNIAGWTEAITGFGELDHRARLDRLADPAFRTTLRDAAKFAHAEREHPLAAVPPHYETWVIINTTRDDYFGRTLTDVAEQLGMAPTDVLCDLAIEDDLQTEVKVPHLNNDRAVITVLNNDEVTLIGLGDSGAHVASITNFSYPTEFLSRDVRDEQRIPLERAVRRMTSEPATFFGIGGRGVLQAGNYADVCVIDLDRLERGPLVENHDLPGGARRLFMGASGYVAVVVNGEITIDHDQFTGHVSGRAVRSGA